jgi:hypothetical protein
LIERDSGGCDPALTAFFYAFSRAEIKKARIQIHDARPDPQEKCDNSYGKTVLIEKSARAPARAPKSRRTVVVDSAAVSAPIFKENQNWGAWTSWRAPHDCRGRLPDSPRQMNLQKTPNY